MYQRTRNPIIRINPLLLCLAMTITTPALADAAPVGFRPEQKLLDLSGLAWVGDDMFLAVHDAKFPEQQDRIRVSLLILPHSLEGFMWKPLHPSFPGTMSSDLESASRVPGTPYVLLVESGDDENALDRIFLAEVKHDRVEVREALEWRTFYPQIDNVEATAVVKSGNGFLFIWAERAEGSANTIIHWTDLRLDPFSIGSGGTAGMVTFTLPKELTALYNRPLVGLDIDSLGRIYSAAAFDPGSDNGPYKSAVLKLGRVSDGAVVLDIEPTVLGTVDGFKTESVVVNEQDKTKLFIGTDDENYGGTLRILLSQPYTQ